MTAEEFTSKQETLELTNVALAEALGTSESAISLWARGKRPIPDTVANLLNFHVVNKYKEVEIPLSLTELFALSDLATRRGQSVKELLLSLIKKAITPEAQTTGTNTAPDSDSDPSTGQFLPFPLPADTDTARVAEDSPDYKFNPKPKPETDTTK